MWDTLKFVVSKIQATDATKFLVAFLIGNITRGLHFISTSLPALLVSGSKNKANLLAKNSIRTMDTLYVTVSTK